MKPVSIVAIGDSVMWGQGHTDDTKFVSGVLAWLKGRGYAPNLTLSAHSGAIATATNHDQADPQWGEVPEAAPSILHQCELGPTDADLVLVNGGINDVSAFHIVVGDPFDPNAVQVVRRRTQEVFTGPVYRLLTRASQRFPNATVVVLGYFPIISELTDSKKLAGLMKNLRRPADVPNTLDWFTEHLEDGVIEVAIAAEKGRMVEQSIAFVEASNALLSASAAALSKQLKKQILFARPAFGPENAFAAPKTWLWFGSDDPIHEERVDKYAAKVAEDAMAWPFYTPIASICHPNKLGAQAYVEAITELLEPLYPKQ